MPSNYPANYFGNVPLINGGPDPNYSSDSYQLFETVLYCNDDPFIQGISVPHSEDRGMGIPAILTHYVTPQSSTPQVDAVAASSGRFSVSVINDKIQVEMTTFFLTE